MREIYPRLKFITIIAGQAIAERYGRALQFFELETTLVDGEAAAFRGHLKIACAAGLIRELSCRFGAGPHKTLPGRERPV